MTDDPIEVIVHPALIEPLKRWLDRRGLVLARLPAELQREGSLESFIVTPTDEVMRRMSEY